MTPCDGCLTCGETSRYYFRDQSLRTPACVQTYVVFWLLVDQFSAHNSFISLFLPAHWWMSVLWYLYITQDCFHIIEPSGSTAF